MMGEFSDGEENTEGNNQTWDPFTFKGTPRTDPITLLSSHHPQLATTTYRTPFHTLIADTITFVCI